MLNRRNLWSILALFYLFMIFIGSESILAQDKNRCTVRFAVIGDRTNTASEGVYESIVAEIVRLHPDFVVSPGDCIEGYGSDENEIRGQWQEYLEIIKPLEGKFYIAPGNHDIWSDMSEQLYHEYIGEPYYSFERGGIHFVMIDFSRWNSGNALPSRQIDWLTEDLRANKNAAFTVAIFHKPAWYKSLPVQGADTVHAIFREYGVDAVFTGHFHEYFSGEYDGILYTNVGSSGGAISEAPSQLEYHYLWVTVDSAGINIAPIKRGSVYDWKETTVADKMIYDPLVKLGLIYTDPLPVGKDMKVSPADIWVTVNNGFSGYDLNDTLVWDIPENWKIEPASLPVSLTTGEIEKFKFHAECLGGLNPLPSISIKFKFKDDRPAHASRPIWIARQAECVPLGSDFNMDGHLSEAFWQYPESLFVNYDGDTMKADPFNIYFAHDDSNLYIGAFCVEMRMDSMMADVEEHDGPVYGEDCLGFFIQPASLKDTCYQIYFNPNGYVYDVIYTRSHDGYFNSDASWNGEYQAKSVMADKSWTFEAKIPVAQLGAKIEKGENWKINFRRKQKPLGAASDWQVPIDSDPQTMGILNIR